MLRYEPKTQVRGFNFAYRRNIPEYAANLIFSLAENDGKVLPGERLWDLTLQRTPLLPQSPLLAAQTRVRMRQIPGDPEKNHMTAALHLIRKAIPTHICGIDADAEHEISAWVPRGDFSYARSFGILRASCDSPHFKGQTRSFLGVSRREGNVPGGALFQPQNIEEARIRLDRSPLSLSGRIRTLNLDLATPARLPLPESFFVLPRRSLFAVYSDWGHLAEPDHEVQAAGVGFVLPFGGDVVGHSSVTLIRFSLYSVLFRKLDGKKDSNPGFLFDFSGEL